MQNIHLSSQYHARVPLPMRHLTSTNLDQTATQATNLNYRQPQYISSNHLHQRQQQIVPSPLFHHIQQLQFQQEKLCQQPFQHGPPTHQLKHIQYFDSNSMQSFQVLYPQGPQGPFPATNIFQQQQQRPKPGLRELQVSAPLQHTNIHFHPLKSPHYFQGQPFHKSPRSSVPHNKEAVKKMNLGNVSSLNQPNKVYGVQLNYLQQLKHHETPFQFNSTKDTST